MSKTASGLPLSVLKAAPVASPEEQWESEGRRIWLAANRSAWEMGDWWAYGEQQAYGERKAIAERIGFDWRACANAGSVARAFTPSRRREVSFSHHAEVAALPEAEQDRWLNEAEREGWSRSQLRQELKILRFQPTPELPEGRFSTVVADPPWTYDEGWPEFADKAGDEHRRLKLPYQSMTVDEIADLDVASFTAPDAHLFLWTTNRYVRDAYYVAEAWGFEPSQLLSWCKPPRGIGPGGVFSNTTEFVIYARRGKPIYNQRVDSTWWSWPRGRHSAKPLEFLKIVEQVCGAGLEMFSRDPQPGWTAWGLEA